MFYSQTFLARKGPLGTVWCAAHLQHRLKKSHYTATDIPSTVERIMFPEVPIALRMSGHLLLGVVRIYSKKVDYLFHDCNIILVGLRKVFTCAQVNLPEDARQAPVQAITLPPTLDLDAMELDGDIFNEGASDNNLSSQEDITLRADQIPIERDLYVAITFDDDIMMDASLPQEFSNINDNLNESPDNGRVSFQDSGQQNQIEVPTTIAAFQDPGPSNQTAAHGATEDYENAGPSSQRRVLESTSNESSEDIQEIEKMRDAPHDSYTKDFSPVHSDNRDDPAEGTALIEQVLSVKETHTPSLNKLASGVSSMPSQQHSDIPTSDASKGPHEVSFEFPSPQLVIQPSPTVQLPRKRRVPRQRFFDEKLVLPNRLMKRALEDCSDLVKKRRKIPCSALGVWKLNNSRKMEQVFTESSLTGLCTDICNMFGREYISTKPHLVPDVVPEPTVPHSTAPTTEPISNIRTEQYPASTPDHGARSSPISAPEIDREIEHLRYNESSVTENIFAEFGSFHSGFMPTPSRRDGSPLSTDRLESGLSPKGVTSSADILSLGGTRASEIDTPRTLLDEQSPQGNTGFSAIPEFGSSDADLYFLEEDSNTSTESGANKGVDSLSVRTRAVAKYLKSHSPISPLSEDSSGDLSLNKILEGKTRKICARMFFETLVLKNYELVDVRQEEAYGDIILTLTSKLSMARI